MNNTSAASSSGSGLTSGGDGSNAGWSPRGKELAFRLKPPPQGFVDLLADRGRLSTCGRGGAVARSWLGPSDER